MRGILQWTLGAMFACIALGAFAQSYPSRPIRLVVPFPAGGTTDILAREAAQKLTEVLGQAVVVDNRPGAAGNIGSDLVAKSAPDGYTLLMGTVGTHAINPSLYSKMPYDHVKDFAPVVLVAGVPSIGQSLTLPWLSLSWTACQRNRPSAARKAMMMPRSPTTFGSRGCWLLVPT